MDKVKVKIYTLGKVKCLFIDKELEVYRKILSLMVYLVLNPGPHSRQHLADLLWGNFDISKALLNLSRNLYCLKNEFPEIESLLNIKKDRIEYKPAGAVWVDSLNNLL